jgi:small subunit ribosomal protein S2
MPVPEIKEMLEAGVHFGHLTKRWNPKMKKFILTERNGIYVVDLSKTQECLNKAIDALRKIRHSGKTILFVGTKKTIKDCIKEEAVRCGQHYVTERWLGGMLTNFSTVKKSIKRLEEIEKMEADGLFKEFNKKEVLTLNKERGKLEGIFSGIRNMKSLPGALFIVDSEHEEIAVHDALEARVKGTNDHLGSAAVNGRRPPEIVGGLDRDAQLVEIQLEVLVDVAQQRRGAELRHGFVARPKGERGQRDHRARLDAHRR